MGRIKACSSLQAKWSNPTLNTERSQPLKITERASNWPKARGYSGLRQRKARPGVARPNSDEFTKRQNLSTALNSLSSIT